MRSGCRGPVAGEETHVSTEGELPYNGSSGGPGASDEVTRYLDEHGVTAKSQKAVYATVAYWREFGATSLEIEEHLNQGHGRISGALSILHMKGHLSLLSLRRQRYRIYILPQFVGDRDTITHKANSKTSETLSYDQIADVVDTVMAVATRSQGRVNLSQLARDLRSDAKVQAEFIRIMHEMS